MSKETLASFPDNPRLSDALSPSEFWAELAAEHAADLAEFGFDNMKRRQALRYFTWRWGARRALRSEQLLYLLRNTSPRAWARCASERVDMAAARWAPLPWSRLERWLYAVAVRLLWTYAHDRDRLGVLRLGEPLLGNPPPVYYRGRLISQDLANSALEVDAIHRLLSGHSPRSILEIGAGYGRVAYVLMSLHPTCSYTVVDIQPALGISERYLRTLFPNRDVTFMTPESVAEIPRGTIDLAFSISSLQEMTTEQIRNYLALVDRVAHGGAVYLKQWSSWYNPKDLTTVTFDDYNIPDRWELAFREPAQVQTNFTHAGWHIKGQ